MTRDLIHYERQSIFFNSKSMYLRNQDRIFYTYMFLEDLSTSIMPISGRRYSGKPFSISVSPDEKQYRLKINLLFRDEFHSNDRLYSSIEGTVSDFIEDCAKRLVVYGPQYYEIIPASISPEMEKENTDFAEPLFVLANISGRVRKIGGVYIQFIPKNLWKKANKKFVILPTSSVWRVSIPRKIGGTKFIEETLKGLFIAGGNHQVGMKMLEESISKKRPFDINSYNRNVELYVAWLTRSWGWDARSSLQRYSLEYYQIYRRVVSAYTLAVFREHIFNGMNSLLNKIGYGCQMEMAGLPTSIFISEMFTKLEKKEISFKEVYDMTDVQ